MPLNTLNTLNILDGVGQWLVHTVGWLSIELLVFACVVYAITRSDLVRSSRVKRWLWTLVLVKPLVAAALGWPLHLATDSRADIAPMAAASVQAVVQPASGNPPLAAPADGTTAALDPASATTLHHTVRRDVGPRLSGFAVLAMLWIGGVASMAGYTVLGALWLGRVRRLAMPLEWADIAASCHEHAPAVQTLMARVDVRLTTRINEPCVYGFFRPSILVPAWCIEDDAPPTLAYILLHEGAHCRARDHWLLWFRRAMETFLWFHPVVWFAGQKAMAEAENVCDEAVVARAKADGTPSAALLYSSCLMRVLERATRHQFEAFVPGVIPTAERIRRLVQQRPTFGVLPSPAAWLAVAAFAVAALPGVLTARSAFATRAVESFLTGRRWSATLSTPRNCRGTTSSTCILCARMAAG
jgi:beta-lactamase regulating signal transducer with metallopeptidase domain